MPAAEAVPGAASAGPAGLGAMLLQPWRELHRIPPFSWLQPEYPVCLVHADGRCSLWIGDRRRQDAAPSECQAARFIAVEVPGDETLECPVPLPPMPEADRRDALALAVRAASPFDAADLVWGWRETADGAVALLSTRKAAQARIDAASALVASAAARSTPPEAWALDRAGRPVVLQGFGEGARCRRAVRARRLGMLLVFTALLLAAAIALTPTVQLRTQALRAQKAYDEAQQRLAPVLAQREALVRAQAQQSALREQMSGRVEPLAVLDLLTQAVPEDSFLQRLQLQGEKLTLIGQTPNTAALMNRLSAQPLLRDVRSPAAATRGMTAGRENFTLEMSVQPEALRPVLAAPDAPVAARMPAPDAGSRAATATASATASSAASAALESR